MEVMRNQEKEERTLEKKEALKTFKMPLVLVELNSEEMRPAFLRRLAERECFLGTTLRRSRDRSLGKSGTCIWHVGFEQVRERITGYTHAHIWL